MPLYAQVADKFKSEGYEREENKFWRNSVYRCSNMVKFDLFNRYGIIAAAGDRHLAEFMPPWYLKDPATAEKMGGLYLPRLIGGSKTMRRLRKDAEKLSVEKRKLN